MEKCLMTLDEINFPDVNYGHDNKEKYYELTTNEWSPFIGCEYWEVFIFSMSYAYAKGIKAEKITGAGSMPSTVFQIGTRDLMRALAIDHQLKSGNPHAIDIIKSPKEYVKLCELYAYAGFKEIYNIIKNNNGENKTNDILMNLIKEISNSRY